MTSCIYKITNNLNGKLYIGKTNDPILRWKVHCRVYKKYTDRYLYRAMLKYGVENFSFEIIQDNIDDSLIDEFEIKYIKELNTKAPNGYNMTVGGEGTIGRKMTKATKDKLKKANLNRKASEETKKKLSEIHKKRYSDPEERRKLSESMIGHKKKTTENYKAYWKNISDEEKEKRTGHLRSYRIVPVKMLDLETKELIMEFDSVRGASSWIRENTKYTKAGHQNIGKACKGKINYVYGYKWEYSQQGQETNY